MNMQLPKPIQHDLSQGSDEWHSFRLEHFGSSEAATMLGISKLCKRNELLSAKATGDVKEYSSFVQERIFDHGHDVETMARRIISERIGEILSPEVWSFGLLSASIDGVTLDGETAFEHKQINQSLFESVKRQELPDEYMPQCQQIMMVRGCKKAIFVCSDGTEENMVSMEVYPDPDWQKRIALGWRQFKVDLAAYTPPVANVEYIGKPPEQLPALHIEMTGMVTASNLVVFKGQTLAVFAGIKKNLVTAEDFANARATVKWCDGIEEKLEQAKQKALNQTASIADLFSAIDAMIDESKRTRLNLNRQVEAQETNRKNEILANGKKQVREYIAGINQAFGKDFMPVIPDKFLEVVKNKRTLDTRQSATDDEVARIKIEADQISAKIRANLKTLQEMTADYKTLFLDAATLIHKNNDDLIALIRLRISDHEAELAAKKERDRIEAERIASSKKQAEAIAAAEKEKAAEPASEQASKVTQTMGAQSLVNRQRELVEPVKMTSPILDNLSTENKASEVIAVDALQSQSNDFIEFFKTERNVIQRMFKAGDIESIAKLCYLSGYNTCYKNNLKGNAA